VCKSETDMMGAALNGRERQKLVLEKGNSFKREAFGHSWGETTIGSAGY